MNPIYSTTSADAVDKAYRHLKGQIVTLQLKPGSRVRAQEIAMELDLSRTPVREAMARLEHEGLLQRAGGWGYSVRGITEKEAVDLFAVRRALEKQAIKEVFPRITQSLLDTLSALLQEQEGLISESRIQDFRRRSRDFHLVIIAAAQNNVLRKILFSIDDQVRLIGAIIHGARSDRAKEVLSENKRLYEALLSRDENAALRAVEEHLDCAMLVAIQHLVDQAVQTEVAKFSDVVNN